MSDSRGPGTEDPSGGGPPPRMDVMERLGFTQYKGDHLAHILVDTVGTCPRCPHRRCTYTCPALCYEVGVDTNIIFNYEGCVECGTCLAVCDQGAVEWHHPRGTFGVRYKYG